MSLIIFFLLFFLLLAVYLPISTLFHELGHVLFGRIAGLAPYRVHIGAGKDLFVFELLKIRFIMKRKFWGGGLTFLRFRNFEHFRIKLFFYSLGGPISDLLIIGVALVLFRFEWLRGFLFVVFIVQLMSFMLNMIPMNVTRDGTVYPRDGKKMLMALFTNYEKDLKDAQRELLQMLKRYGVEDNSFLNNDLSAFATYNEGAVALHEGDFESAIATYENLMRHDELSKAEKVYILEILTSSVIYQGRKEYMDKAEEWSKHALALLPESPTIVGTRAAILIERGDYAGGIKMLLPLTEEGNEKTDRVISACYIAKAYFHLGNEEEMDKWLSRVKSIGDSDWADAIVKRIEIELNHEMAGRRLSYLEERHCARTD